MELVVLISTQYSWEWMLCVVLYFSITFAKNNNNNIHMKMKNECSDHF